MVFKITNEENLDIPKVPAIYGYEGEEVREVTIPNDIKGICDNAFYDCEQLEKVKIPESVEIIGVNAFACCRQLKDVEFSENAKVKVIDECAFDRCDSLENIKIPESVEVIGYDAFCDCENLKNIEVAEDNKKYCSVDGVLYNKEMTELIKYPPAKPEKEFTVPDGVTHICCGNFEGAFSKCENLEKVNLPESLERIGVGAFSECINLESVKIPDNVKIEQSAFYGCPCEENKDDFDMEL